MAEMFTAEEIAAGFGFLEGPRWHEGRLWVSDFHRHLVFAIDPVSGSVETIGEVPNQPSGLGFTSTGELFVVSMTDRRLLRLGDGEFRPFADVSGLSRHPINDMVVDAADRFYITSFGCTPWIDQTLEPAPIIRVDPDGSAVVVNQDLSFPNGLVLSADGSTLYVADQFGCRLAVYAVSAGGDLTFESFHAFAPTVHATMPSGWASRDFLPDGIALDSVGRVWVSNANGSNVAWVDPKTGDSAIVEIDNVDDRVYAVAFDDEDRLFACIAPRVETWDTEREFPSRLVRLNRI
jgi:sugar lactone lactonase YvrE